MNLLYDAAGSILYAVPDAQAATFTHSTTGSLFTYHVDEIAANASILEDITRTLFGRDQNHNGKYYVSAGVLTLRQGWLPMPLPGLVPFTPDPAYHTTDQPIAVVVVQPRELAKAALVDTQDPTRIADRNSNRIMFGSVVQARQAYNTLAADYDTLVADYNTRFGTNFPKAHQQLANRTFAQAMASVRAQIDAETDPTQ